MPDINPSALALAVWLLTLTSPAAAITLDTADDIEALLQAAAEQHPDDFEARRILSELN